MEDVLTDIPPPSRFFLEDLNNFTPPPPPLPSPFILFSPANQKSTFRPSLLIIAMSSPALHFFHHLSSKSLIGTLILPEIDLSGNSIEVTLRNLSCNIYALNHTEKSIMIISIQCPVTAERAHAVAKLLIGKQINPERVLILDSVQPRNFRGKLPPDETFVLKLETSAESKASTSAHKNSTLIKGVDYFPSGSVVDGLAAALLGQCQMRNIQGTLCVSWPESGISISLCIKSLLLKDVLPSLEHQDIGNTDVDFMKFGHSNNHAPDSELYT